MTSLRPPAVPAHDSPALLVATPAGALDGGAGPVVAPDVDDPGHVVVTFRLRANGAHGVQLVLTGLPRLPLEQEPGTDRWHRSIRMPAGWRASYGFVVDEPAPADGPGEPVMADPENPRTCPDRHGVVWSVVEGPEAPEQLWVDSDPGVRVGEVEEATAPSGRRVWVHRPPGAGPTGPLVVVLDGDAWVGGWSLPVTVANLVADDLVRRPTVVLVDSRRGAAPASADEVVEELLPWVQRTLGSGLDPEDVVVAGQGPGALEALRVVLAHPDRVAVAIAQSPASDGADLPVAGPPAPAGVRVRIEAGTLDGSPDSDLLERLRAAGLEVSEAPFAGGADPACWRGGIAESLIWALGDDEPA